MSDYLGDVTLQVPDLPPRSLPNPHDTDKTILGMDTCHSVTAVSEVTKDCYYLAHRPTEEVVLSLCDYLDIDWNNAEDDVAHMENIVELQESCPPEIVVFDEHFQNLLATIFSHIADFMERRGQDPDAPCVILGGLVSESTVSDIMSAARLSLATYHRQSQPLSDGATLADIVQQRKLQAQEAAKRRSRREKRANRRQQKAAAHVDPAGDAEEDPFCPRTFNPGGGATDSPSAPAVLQPNKVPRAGIGISVTPPDSGSQSARSSPTVTPTSARRRQQTANSDAYRKMSSCMVLSPDEMQRLEALKARMGKRQSVAGPEVEMMLKGALAGDDGRTEEQHKSMQSSKRRKASRVIRPGEESPGGLDPLEQSGSHTPKSPSLGQQVGDHPAASSSAADLRSHLQAFRLGASEPSEPSNADSDDDQTLSQTTVSHNGTRTPRRRLPSLAANVVPPSDLEQRLKTLTTLQYLDLILQTLSALVALVYEEQLRELTIEGETSGVSRLAEWCAARIIDEFAEEDIDPELPLDLQLLHVIQGVAFEDGCYHYRRLNPMDAEVLQTVWGVVLPPDVTSSRVATKDPSRQWYEWGVLNKPGFVTYRSVYYNSARLNPSDYKYRRCLKGLPDGLELTEVNPTAALPRPSFLERRPGENLCSIPIPVDGAAGAPVALLTLSAPPEGSTHKGSNRAKPHIKPTNPRACRELEKKYKQKRKRNRIEQLKREQEREAREALEQGGTPPPQGDSDYENESGYDDASSAYSSDGGGVGGPQGGEEYQQLPEEAAAVAVEQQHQEALAEPAPAPAPAPAPPVASPNVSGQRSPPPGVSVRRRAADRTEPVTGDTPQLSRQASPNAAAAHQHATPSPTRASSDGNMSGRRGDAAAAGTAGSSKRIIRTRGASTASNHDDTDTTGSVIDAKHLPGPPRSRKDTKEKCCVVS